MKILFIATSFYSNDKIKGGMAKYLYNIIKILRKKHKIILLIPANFNITIPQVSIYHYYKSKVPIYTWLVSLISIIPQILRILIKERPNIISNFLPNLATSFIFPLCKLFKCKTIMNFRGFSEPDSKFETAMIRTFNTITYFFTDVIITNSNDFIQKFRNVVIIGKNHYDSIRKFFIPNGINPNFWNKRNFDNSKNFDICFVGNLYNRTRIRMKGLNYLLDALKIIENKYNKKLLVDVIGDYSLKAIKEEIRDFDNSFFHFTGSLLNFEDVRNQIQQSQIYVLSSISEGMPNALMEAMCCEIPSIATNVGGVSKLITNYENGFIVQPHNSKDLAKKIWELLSNKEIQNKFGKLGRSTMIEKFSWKHNVYLIERIYFSI